MRIRLALACLLCSTPLGAQPATSPTYSTPALGALVDAAARDNVVPPGLLGYRATVESELALAVRRDNGIEAIVAVEQVASTLRWSRDGEYEQHVVGYRARQAVPTLPMLPMLETGWIAPVLYGERLFPPRPPTDSARGRLARRAARRTVTLALHPLGIDRARWYTFSGGDTIVTLRVTSDGGTRAVPIVRVHVEPRAVPPEHASLFRGDMDIDAARHAIVRMRGHYVVDPSGAARGLRGRLLRAALHSYAFVDYETGEREGRYWLPDFQRVEFQIVAPALGESRAVLRIASRLTDVVVQGATVASADDSAPARAARRWRITRAGGDSLQRFDAWPDALGTLTGALHADDFDDVAPDAWRRDGPPRAELVASRGSDLLRFNRVEGLYTGIAGRVRFRDAAPGLTFSAAGGWAWGERTARGRVEITQVLGVRHSLVDSGGGRWTLGARAGRSLDITNDFRNPLDSGSSIAALLGSVDPYDWVDRRLATAFVLRTFGARAALLRVELGAASDRGDATHVSQGLVAGPDPFRPNRGVDAGRYARTAVTLELRPDVAAEFLRPGVGARLFYERGDGSLAFQRAEARIVGRGDVPLALGGALRGSTLTVVARANAGVLHAAEPPPQQLFELGGDENLSAYDYKAFAGDRAGVGRASLIYGSPWWRTPIRVGPVVLPGIAPGFSVGAESGFVSASSPAAERSIARLGPRDVSGALSRPSGGMRAAFDAGLRFFGSSLYVGAARALDHHPDTPRRWRFLFAAGGEM